MSQRPSVETPTQSLKSQSLNSTLQAALASLDVQLEEELVRYRRQRTGRSIPPRGLSRQQTRKTLDLISVGATGGRTQPQAQTMATPAMPASLNTTSRLDITSPSDSPTWQARQNENQDTSSTLAPPPTALALAARPEAPALDPQQDLASGNYANLESTQMPPDDYLASSEELLRSLAEEEAGVRVERGFMQSLLTPLGLGSMLLLLLSSATLGYVIMNPAVLKSMGFGQSSSSTAPAPQPQTSQATTNPEAVGLPNSPNLASQEFVDLNLGTLSTLKANGGKVKTPLLAPAKPPSVRTATSSATSPATGVNSGATVSPAAPLPRSAPEQPVESYRVQPITPSLSIAPAPPPAPIYNAPVEAPPAPAAEAPREAPAPAPVEEPPAVEPAPIAPAPEPPVSSQAAAPSSPSAPAGNYDYKVVTEYSGDATLEQAQKAVPDAYVRNFSDGARIQLGAFDDASKADALVEELEKQGIPAKVEQH